jgi:hypothetical protein
MTAKSDPPLFSCVTTTGLGVGDGLTTTIDGL